MANDNFLLQIQTMLDSKGIKTDYEKIKKTIDSNPVSAKFILDTSASKQAVKDLAKEIHNDLSNMFKASGVDDFKLSIKDVESILSGSLKQAQKEQLNTQKQITKETENTRREYAKMQSASKTKLQQIESQKTKEVNSLLSKQQSEYQSIYAINEKISKLNPTKNSSEIASLQEEKKYHQENYLSLQKQISTYSDVVNNEARINALLEIQKKSRLEIANIKSKQSDIKEQADIADQKAIAIAETQAYKEDLARTNQKISNERKLYLDREQAIKTNENMKIASEKKIQAETKKTEQTVKSKFNLQSDKTILSNRTSAYLRDNTKLTSDFKARLVSLQAEIKNADKIKLDQLKKQFREITSEAESMGATGKNAFSKLAQNAKQLLSFFASTTLILGSARAFQAMVENVTNLNKSMVSLKKVTNETDYAYSKFLNGAAQSAKELGSSIATLVSQTAEWAKAGFNLTDSAELAKVSTIFQNVGDVDAATSVSDIVTPLKAFNLEASQAIEVVNKLNEVDNKFNVSSADIGTGLANSASALALAGNDINQSIALITGGSEITQNAAEQGKMYAQAA